MQVTADGDDELPALVLAPSYESFPNFPAPIMNLADITAQTASFFPAAATRPVEAPPSTGLVESTPDSGEASFLDSYDEALFAQLSPSLLMINAELVYDYYPPIDCMPYSYQVPYFYAQSAHAPSEVPNSNPPVHPGAPSFPIAGTAFTVDGTLLIRVDRQDQWGNICPLWPRFYQPRGNLRDFLLPPSNDFHLYRRAPVIPDGFELTDRIETPNLTALIFTDLNRGDMLHFVKHHTDFDNGSFPKRWWMQHPSIFHQAHFLHVKFPTDVTRRFIVKPVMPESIYRRYVSTLHCSYNRRRPFKYQHPRVHKCDYGTDTWVIEWAPNEGHLCSHFHITTTNLTVMGRLFLTGLNPAYSIDQFCILEAAYEDATNDQTNFCRALFNPYCPPREIFPILQKHWINRFFYPDLRPLRPEYSVIPHRSFLPWAQTMPPPEELPPASILGPRHEPNNEYRIEWEGKANLPLQQDYHNQHDEVFPLFSNDRLLDHPEPSILDSNGNFNDQIYDVERMYARPLQCIAPSTYIGFDPLADNMYKYNYFPHMPTPTPIICSDHTSFGTGMGSSGIGNPSPCVRNRGEMHLHDLTLVGVRASLPIPDSGRIIPPRERNLVSGTQSLLFMISSDSVNDLVSSVSSVSLDGMLDSAPPDFDLPQVTVLTDTFSIDPDVFNQEPPPPDSINPFPDPVPLTPEEAATPLPGAFSGLAPYTTKDYATFLKEDVYDLFESHVAPEFLEAVKELKPYLRSDQFIKRFAPHKWSGLKNIPPLEIATTTDLPPFMRARSRPVPAPLEPVFMKEIKRMLQYFYRHSNSPFSSPLVIAAKATAPFIRIAGDYRGVNRFMIPFQEVIPDVQIALQRTRLFNIFLDIDLMNAFHQIRLGWKTSRLLAVATPLGLLEPIFAPEGAIPMSAVLQHIVNIIFGDFSDWCIFIFDNILVLCTDYADAFVKLQRIINRAAEYNMVFKMAKTYLGFKSCTFFGYKVSAGSYEITAQRKESISKFQFPFDIKSMQRFLGVANYLKPFVKNYSELTAPLHDMTHKDFAWSNKASWTVDYESHFELFKAALLNAQALIIPNYDYQWILRVDASKFAVGSTLVQLRPTGATLETGKPEVIEEFLSFDSSKLSKPMQRWDTHKLEAYACYKGVMENEYFLLGKAFILETDHANLLYIAQSTSPIVIRWFWALRRFRIYIRYIKGSNNIVADFLSRMHPPDMVALLDEVTAPPPEKISQAECLKQAHCRSQFHRGAAATWSVLNKLFPGHGIPFALVAQFIEDCIICRKVRTGLQSTLVPIHRNLIPPENKRCVGWDGLTITPVSKAGHSNASVFVDRQTGLVSVFPRKDYTADSLAATIFSFFARHGFYDILYSDPGSDICSKAVEQVNKWFGVTHVISLVNRPQSSGVENANGKLLRFLITMFTEDPSLRERWSDPDVLDPVVFHCNDAHQSEFGGRPFVLTYGSRLDPYFKLPLQGFNPATATEQLLRLDEDLKTLQRISLNARRLLIDARASADPEVQTVFQPGDFVLSKVSKPKASKLSPNYAGPYQVIQQVKNDVECKHVVIGHVVKLHVEKLGLFPGTAEEAFRMASLDHSQYLVTHFSGYRGNPLQRTGMEFLVHFADGDALYLPFSRDLFITTHFENFCRERNELFTLLYDAEEAKRRVSLINRQPLTAVPHSQFYLNLRFFGVDLYDEFQDLRPAAYSEAFYYSAAFGDFLNPKTKTKIAAKVPVRNQILTINGYAYRSFCMDALPAAAILIDKALTKEYPLLASL